MTVTVVGATKDALRICAELLDEGRHVRLVRDGRADAPVVVEPTALDGHAATLLERAATRRDPLEREGVFIEERPLAATPSLRPEHPRMEVIADRRVVAFSADANRRVTHLHVETADGAGGEDLPVDDALVLAADTLTTTRIFLESWRRATGENARLTGVLRHREIRARFVTTSMIGRPVDERVPVPPRVAITLREHNADDIRGWIATAEPERLPADVAAIHLDIRTSFRLVREARAALGSVVLTLPDWSRAACAVELDAGELAVRWEPPTGDRARRGRVLARTRRALRALGSWMLPGAGWREANANGEYAGTLPMTEEERPFTTRGDGSSREFEGLYIVGDAAKLHAN